MKVAKTTVKYDDVISFFEDADLDLANLTHQLVTSKLNSRIEKKQEIGERLTKARKARKPKGSGEAGEVAAAPAVTEANAQGHPHVASAS